MSARDRKSASRCSRALRKMFEGAYDVDKGLVPPIEIVEVEPRWTLNQAVAQFRFGSVLKILAFDDPVNPDRGALVVDKNRIAEFVAEYVAASPILMSQKIAKAYARRHGIEVRAIAPEEKTNASHEGGSDEWGF